MRSMAITILALTGLMALGGCVEPRTKRTGSTQLLGISLSASAPLSTNAQAMAYDVCLSLRSKNTLFRSDMDGHKFVFNMEYMSCNQETFQTSVEAVLESKDVTKAMNWKATGNRFFNTVETHEYGYMSLICPDVMKGSAPSNTYTAQDKSMIQYQFYTVSKGIVGVTASTAVSNGQGGYTVIKVDELEFVTGVIGNNAYLGIEYSHIQTIPCANGKSEKLTQKYLHD